MFICEDIGEAGPGWNDGIGAGGANAAVGETWEAGELFTYPPGFVCDKELFM